MQLTSAFHDEFILSHIARLRILNRIKTNTLALRQLKNLHRKGNIYRQTYGLCDLAKISGLELNIYINKHTLLPHIALSTGLKLSHEDTKFNYKKLHKRANKPLKEMAMYCQRCVEEDQQNYGFSYWRCHLQVPGIFQCTLHGEALNSINTVSAFEYLPNHWNYQT